MGLSERNFNLALQASCSIPFVLQAVHNIPGAPPGAYWDGGITDYHLHLNYPGAAKNATNSIATYSMDTAPRCQNDQQGLVLYPHFQKTVVPDRTDFTHYGQDLAARVKAWNTACSASAQLVDESVLAMARGSAIPPAPGTRCGMPGNSIPPYQATCMALRPGALVVHELRKQMGEGRFWKGLRHYTRAHWGQSVETADFQHAMESSSGLDLQAFFKRWVYPQNE